MSANAGEELGRISKIASGGELSRIMLAMKNVFAENDPVATMIFDEIDTGVSGIAAQRVGEKLFLVSKGKQVLCVTHLPQIAAMADAHYRIAKAGAGRWRTYTQVSLWTRDGRRMSWPDCTAAIMLRRHPCQRGRAAGDRESFKQKRDLTFSRLIRL